jgi:hypothetical protein
MSVSVPVPLPEKVTLNSTSPGSVDGLIIWVIIIGRKRG